MAIRRIGQILVDLGFISDDQLEMLLEEQDRQPGEKLGRIAEEMGLITEEQLALALAETGVAEVLLAVFMGSILVVWAVMVMDHARVLPMTKHPVG